MKLFSKKTLGLAFVISLVLTLFTIYFDNAVNQGSLLGSLKTVIEAPSHSLYMFLQEVTLGRSMYLLAIIWLFVGPLFTLVFWTLILGLIMKALTFSNKKVS